jgi:phosphomannomutase/phosphoglucomutase
MLITSIIAISALVALLAFFIGYRKLSSLLTQDMGSVLKACKDMMTHKLQGTYPVKLAEMDAVVSTLVQFKRVMDYQDDDVADHNHAVDFEMSGFFDEPEKTILVGGTTLWSEETEQNKKHIPKVSAVGNLGEASAPAHAPRLRPVGEASAPAHAPRLRPVGEASAPAHALRLRPVGEAETADVSFNKPEIIEKPVPDSFDMTPSIKKQRIPTSFLEPMIFGVSSEKR